MAGQSLIALKIARVVVRCGLHPRLSRLLPAGAAASTAALLASCGLLPEWMLSALGRPGVQRLSSDLERAISPGVTVHMALRKRFVDEEAGSALSEGTRQVLVVGSGYDTLAVRRAPRHPDAVFVEIERPVLMNLKRSGVERLVEARPNLHLLGADLAVSPLPEVMAGVGTWDPSAPSLVVAEGVLMYLPPEAVDRFLAAVRTISGTGSRLVFTYLESDARGRPTIGRLSSFVRFSTRLIGEPWRWSIRRDDLSGFLRERGFRADLSAARTDLRRRFADLGEDLVAQATEVERVAVAESV